jgi:hypothetical protein
MRKFLTALSLLLVSLLFGCVFANAQDPFRPRRDEPPPQGVREMMEKVRIDKEKKDYQEMVDRGETTVRLATQIEHSYTERGVLSEEDRNRLQEVEKDVKKIRSDLGGGDMDDKEEDKAGEPMTIASAVADLKAVSEKLLDEIKRRPGSVSRSLPSKPQTQRSGLPDFCSEKTTKIPAICVFFYAR